MFKKLLACLLLPLLLLLSKSWGILLHTLGEMRPKDLTPVPTSSPETWRTWMFTAPPGPSAVWLLE